jgi:ABC-2 type transport system permease protein
VRSLLYKDLLLQKKMWFFPFGYGFFLFIVFNNPIFKDLIYNMGTVAVAYVMLMTAVSFDEKNSTDVILVSLPINRKKIVLEKYLLAFLVVFIGWGIMGLLGAIIKISGIIDVTRLINFNDLLFSLSSVLLLSSVYFPAYLKLGYKYSRYINLTIFLLLFFLPSWLTEYLVQNVDKKGPLTQKITVAILDIPTPMIGFALLTITLVLALISYLISVKLYIHKEF